MMASWMTAKQMPVLNKKGDYMMKKFEWPEVELWTIRSKEIMAGIDVSYEAGLDPEEDN